MDSLQTIKGTGQPAEVATLTAKTRHHNHGNQTRKQAGTHILIPFGPDITIHLAQVGKHARPLALATHPNLLWRRPAGIGGRAFSNSVNTNQATCEREPRQPRQKQRLLASSTTLPNQAGLTTVPRPTLRQAAFCMKRRIPSQSLLRTS